MIYYNKSKSQKAQAGTKTSMSDHPSYDQYHARHFYIRDEYRRDANDSAELVAAEKYSRE
jgi:hypothetical protein